MLTITNEDNKDLMLRYPDKHFDLAIVDPPYGSAIGGREREKLKRGRFGGRFEKYHIGEKVSHATGGGSFTKYGDGAKHWDIAPDENYFLELFRVSRYQIIWGGNYFPLPPSRNFIVWRKLSISESFSMAMVDNPETIYFIRREKERMEAQSLAFRIEYPRYRNTGGQKTMWNLIPSCFCGKYKKILFYCMEKVY
jgi:site-specific DNA-methyltransferase (adenine-specific)